jgi:hypothetical protein
MAAFSYAAAVPVSTPGYVSLRQDTHLLKNYLQKHVGAGKIGTLHIDIGDARILIEGHEPFIAWFVAEDIDHAIRAFADKHAITPFVYKSNWNGEAREETLGVHRQSTPASRGEPLPPFEDVLLESTFEEFEELDEYPSEAALTQPGYTGASAALDD